MIDTSRYAGHTPAPWQSQNIFGDISIHANITCGYIAKIRSYDTYDESMGKFEIEANARLIADAPLLLAEVERLREQLQIAVAALVSLSHSHMPGLAMDAQNTLAAIEAAGGE